MDEINCDAMREEGSVDELLAELSEAPESPVPLLSLGGGHFEQSSKPSTVIGRVPILGHRRLVGEGASGKVLPVTDTLDGQKYVLKVVPIKDAEKSGSVVAEAQVHARLHHENIVRYVFSWMENGSLSLMLEDCGMELWERLPTNVSKDGHMRSLWAKQISSAVAHIHECGIVHRDLNPYNVFVSRTTGNAKVGDFGLSAICEPGSQLKGMETPGACALDVSALGSLYSAPDLGSEEGYDFKVDVFSLGMLLFAIFDDADSHDSLISHVEALRYSARGELPPSLLSMNPESLQRIILECTAMDPSGRPTSQSIMFRICTLGERSAPSTPLVINRANTIETSLDQRREAGPFGSRPGSKLNNRTPTPLSPSSQPHRASSPSRLEPLPPRNKSVTANCLDLDDGTTPHGQTASESGVSSSKKAKEIPGKSLKPACDEAQQQKGAGNARKSAEMKSSGDLSEAPIVESQQNSSFCSRTCSMM